MELPDVPEAATDRDMVTATRMTRDTEASRNIRGRFRINATHAPFPLGLSLEVALVPSVSEEVSTGSSGVVMDGSLAKVPGLGSPSLLVAAFSTTCLAIVRYLCFTLSLSFFCAAPAG